MARREQLFDLAADPHETRDVAASEREVAKRLGADLDRVLALPRKAFDPSDDR